MSEIQPAKLFCSVCNAVFPDALPQPAAACPVCGADGYYVRPARIGPALILAAAVLLLPVVLVASLFLFRR